MDTSTANTSVQNLVALITNDASYAIKATTAQQPIVNDLVGLLVLEAGILPSDCEVVQVINSIIKQCGSNKAKRNKSLDILRTRLKRSLKALEIDHLKFSVKPATKTAEQKVELIEVVEKPTESATDYLIKGSKKHSYAELQAALEAILLEAAQAEVEEAELDEAA